MILFNCRIDALSESQTLTEIDRIITTKNPTQHVVINVAKLVAAQRDMALRKAINGCGLINADGQGIVYGARLLGLHIPGRVAGIDLFEKLVSISGRKKYKLFFLGAKQEVVEKVVEVLRKKYPDIMVAGYRNGYYNEDEEPGIANLIKNSKADILFVAMGSPQKEFFLAKHLNQMGVPFAMGVGGSFDIIAGVCRRAPLWMQKFGLEWFYRFLNEPGRMWKRYLFSNCTYAWLLFKAMLFGKVKYGCSE